MITFILISLFVIGAVLGSFACCQAWRWRYKIEGKKPLGERSVCLHCGYQLKWYDNIPVISWLLLRGKCRKCKAKIGIAEILSELGMGAAFVAMGQAYLVPIIYYWNILVMDPWELVVRLAIVILTLAMLVVLGVLAVYDAKWGELPVALLTVSVVMGAIILVLKEIQLWLTGGDVLWGLISAAIGVLILAGVCFAIYKVSHERLMGGGDWILALALALAIGDWWLSLWAMFLANLLGDIIMLPTLLQKGNHVIHFGPFLAIGFVLVLWLGNCLPALLI